jgi:hypothetical protein
MNRRGKDLLSSTLAFFVRLEAPDRACLEQILEDVIDIDLRLVQGPDDPKASRELAIRCSKGRVHVQDSLLAFNDVVLRKLVREIDCFRSQ